MGVVPIQDNNAIEAIRWNAQLDCWVVSGNALIRECFAADSKLLSSNFSTLQREMLPESLHRRFSNLLNLSDNALTQQDGIYHDYIRKAITPTFNRVVKANTAKFEKIIAHQTASLPDKFDLVVDVADPIAKRAICEVMNVPPHQQDSLVSAALDVLEFFNLDKTLTSKLALDRIIIAENGFRIVQDFFEQQILRHNPEAPKGFVGAILTMRERESSLGPGNLEIIYQATTLFMAGFVTTTSLISQVLGEHVSAPSEMAADPATFRVQLESALRRAGPTLFVLRRALYPFSLGGKNIAAGDILQLRLADGNNDPEVYDTKCPISSVREKESHLTFGEGQHVCPGASMAKILLIKVLESFRDQQITFDRLDKASEHRNTRFQAILGHLNMAVVAKGISPHKK